MKATRVGRTKTGSVVRPKSRILLADENALSARLLARALEDSSPFQVTDCVTDGESLHRAMRERKPDILLLSSRLQELATHRFRQLKPLIDAHPEVPCVVLLERSDRDIVVDAFRAGAKGVFPCSHGDVESLKKCIRRVLEGQIWADTSQLHYIISALPSLVGNDEVQKARELRRLTTREEQVARHVAAGMANREIAILMKLRENTIKNYVFRIYDKLGLSNRVELALYAMKSHETALHPLQANSTSENDKHGMIVVSQNEEVLQPAQSPPAR
jgi:DNA-binding NarL/FixJ family response regulator